MSTTLGRWVGTFCVPVAYLWGTLWGTLSTQVRFVYVIVGVRMVKFGVRCWVRCVYVLGTFCVESKLRVFLD